MKKSILRAIFILLCLPIFFTSCEDPIYLTTSTDVLTVFLYDAYTGVPILATDITTVEITNSGITSSITAVENSAGIITTTMAADLVTVLDTSLKFYNFESSEMIKILILTTSYIRYEAYVTPVATSRYPVYAAFMLPAASVVQSPAYTIEIQDGGTAITAGGKYLIVPASGTPLVLGANIDTTAGSTPTILIPYLPPNWGGNNGAGDGAISPLFGAIPATGQIAIPADTLYPRVIYSVYIYDVPGYQDSDGTDTFQAGVDNSAVVVPIGLSAM